VAFDVAENVEQSPVVMLEALKTGKIDVLITWQPAVGAFLRHHPELEVVAIPNARTLGAPEQYSFPMSMAVRTSDQALKKRLDDVIEKHQAELSSVLSRNGVKLYTPREK
jgi:mxaJ protein